MGGVHHRRTGSIAHIVLGAIAVLAAAGCGDVTPERLAAPESIDAARPGSLDELVLADRLADRLEFDTIDWTRCPFPNLVGQSSHLLDVEITARRTELIPSTPTYGFAPGDSDEPAPVEIDVADLVIRDVINARADDPRIGVAPAPDAGTTITAMSHGRDGADVGVLAITASMGQVPSSQRLMVATGRYDVGTIEEWPIHFAALVDSGDAGTVTFLGPCGEEYTRQLHRIIDGVFPEASGESDLAQLELLHDSALRPDVGGNVLYFARPPLDRQIGDGLMPSLIAPTVRRLHYVLFGSERSDETFTLQSAAGNTTFVGFADPAGYESTEIVASTGPIRVAMLDRRGSGYTALPLEGAYTGSLDGVEALRVDLDLATMTTSISPIDLEDIAALLEFAQPASDVRQGLANPIVATPGTASIDWRPR